MPRGQITTLTKANKNSKSLRTTVPSSIINQFGLKEGDKLRWQFVSHKKGEISITLEPIMVDMSPIGNDGDGGNEVYTNESMMSTNYEK